MFLLLWRNQHKSYYILMNKTRLVIHSFCATFLCSPTAYLLLLAF